MYSVKTRTLQGGDDLLFDMHRGHVSKARIDNDELSVEVVLAYPI